MSSIIPVPSPAYGLLAQDSLARGDAIADAVSMRTLAGRLNMLLGRRMKVLYRATLPLDSTAPASSLGYTVIHRGQFSTSCNPRAVKVRLLCMSSDYTVGTDPYYQFTVGGVSQSVRRIAVDTASVTPNTLRHDEQRFLDGSGANLAGSTPYEFLLTVHDQCRVVGILIYEVTRSTLDTTAHVACPLDPLAIGAPVLAREIETMNNAAWSVWKNQGPAHMCWSTYGTPSQTGTTYKNPMDSSTAGYSSGAAGQWFYGADHGRYSANTVPCVFWCYASTNAGSNGRVRFTDSGGTMATITGIGTTPQMYTSTVNVTCRDSLVVVEHSNSNAGQTTTTTAAGFFELG